MKFQINYKLNTIYEIALAFLLVSGLLTICISLFNFYNSPDRITKEIQREYKIVENNLLEKTNRISSRIQNDIFDAYNVISNADNEYQFYIFQADSLIFWNNNGLSVNELNLVDCSQQLIKTSNGYYMVHCKGLQDGGKIMGAYRIQTNFRYQNKFLQNRLVLNQKVFEKTEITDEITSSKVYNRSGQPVFSLRFTKQDSFPGIQFVVIFILYLVLYSLFILLLISSLRHFVYQKSKAYFAFYLGILLIIIFRVIQVNLKFPAVLYDHEIFGPQIFTFKLMAVSLGDLILDILSLVIITVLLQSILRLTVKKNSLYFVIAGVLLIIFYSAFIMSFIKAIVFDSIVPFNFNQIYHFNFLSGLALLLICTVIFCTYDIISGVFRESGLMREKSWIFWVYFFSGSLLIILLFMTGILNKNSLVLSYVLFLIFFMSEIKRQPVNYTVRTVLFVLVNSGIISVSIYLYQLNKDDNNQLMAASELSSDQRDPVVEYLFSNLEDRFSSDISIQQKLDSLKTNIDYPVIEKTIREQYFGGYWTNFDVQLTICEPDDTLKLIPETYKQNCYHYFQGLISDFGEPTSFSNLQFINYGPGDKSYLASFIIETGKREYKIYAEITPKNYGSELGLPDLLVDERKGNRLNELNYSTALYVNGILYSHSGDYNYHQENHTALADSLNFTFTEEDGYKHIHYKTGSQKQIVVSRKNLNIIEQGATFTFFLLVLTAFFAIALQIRNLTKTSRNTGIQSQLQRFISFVLVVSFLFTSVFSVVYINQFNSSKVEKDLNEKTHSVMLELQYKIASNPTRSYTNDFFDELLIKFSSVFFSDINIYGLDGRLISTSRPQIFSEGIIGDQMNPEAFYQMSVQKKSFLIHNEDIGRLNFLSSYMPVKDISNNVVAYLNLPYFARQTELQTEVLAFLVRFVNIFLLILIAGLSVGFLLANYFSKPLLLLINNMKTVTLGGRNSLPEWRRKDEIGELIRQYNTLLAELEESALKLAISERESAWREMARQIAHEIKNPLTPMKLSVQFLKKAWEDKDPKWEDKYNSFTTTMIDQIDALSEIASDFSEFSKIKTNTLEPVNLKPIAKNSVLLFSGNRNIEIEIQTAENIDPVILADKDQMTRLFNNLIKNAVQAVEHVTQGRVVVKIMVESELVKIAISDNGPGIPAELKDKIFQPNFTTKTGGMGLGLAIAKAITDSFHGTIDHTPNSQSGTTFSLVFPLFRTGKIFQQ